MVNWKIQLSELNYDNEEQSAVKDVLLSEWLTIGERSISFEKEFSKFLVHQTQGIFVSSATAALHLILIHLGVGQGDEVIIPGLTFVSDANVIRQLNARVVFADAKSKTDFNISLSQIKKSVTKNTKCIVVVHFAGFPCEIEEISKFCKEKNIVLVEDCAHAPGSLVQDRFCGTFGDYSFFSFFSNKNIAIGEGGMIICRNERDMNAIRLLRSHGMSAPTLDRHLGRSETYDVLNVGLNYRPDEIRAALGLVQLNKVLEGNKKRQKLSERYRNNFLNTKITVAFGEMDLRMSSCHIFCVLLPEETKRSFVMSYLKSHGIQTSIHYPAFHTFTEYRKLIKKGDLPIVDIICDRELTLPLHPRLTTEDVDFVSKKLIEVTLY